MADGSYEFTISGHEFREIQLQADVEGKTLTETSSRSAFDAGGSPDPESGLILAMYDPGRETRDPYRAEGATQTRRTWNRILSTTGYSAANFCGGNATSPNLRRPDWIEYHPRNPNAGTQPGTHALHHFPVGGQGNGFARAANLHFRAISNQRLLLNSLYQGRSYIFGFFEALTFPIQIRVIEQSQWRTQTRRELIGNAWEAIRIRFGWHEALAGGGRGFFLTDPPLETRYTNAPGVNIRQSTNVSDQMFTIQAADLLPNTINGPIHWLMIEDVTDERYILRNGGAVNLEENGTGADIHLKLCSPRGPGLDIAVDVPVYISLVIDVSGSTLTSPTRIEKIKNTIRNLKNTGEFKGKYFYSIRLLGSVVDGAGAPVGADNIYTQTDPSDSSRRIARPDYQAYADDRVHNTASRLVFSFADSGSVAETSRVARVEQLVNQALDQGERYAYSPIWRAMVETADDIAAVGSTPANSVHLVILFSDGDDTMGGAMGSSADSPSIMNRKEASTRANGGSLPANPESLPAAERDAKLKEINDGVAAQIADHVNGLLSAVEQNRTGLSAFQQKLRELKYDRKIGGSFIITNPDLPPNHPLVRWLGGETTNLDDLIDARKRPITRLVTLNTRWCHPNCRANRGFQPGQIRPLAR